MPKDYNRIERIADLIRKELTGILQREISDPRLRLITIQSVKVSKDLAFADILFTQLASAHVQDNQSTAQETTVKLLTRAAPRLRYLLAQRLKLRVIPVLRFFYDDSYIQNQRLQGLIDNAIIQDKIKRSK
jgi:ribosome-binding factor A